MKIKKNNKYNKSNCISGAASITKEELSHHLTFDMKNESVESNYWMNQNMKINVIFIKLKNIVNN